MILRLVTANENLPRRRPLGAHASSVQEVSACTRDASAPRRPLLMDQARIFIDDKEDTEIPLRKQCLREPPCSPCLRGESK